VTCAFIRDHKIDSYLKLQVLLHLRRNSCQGASLIELADRFFVADHRRLEKLMNELCQQGLLHIDAWRWALHDQPDIAYCLGCLERTFDDPMARQRLLRQISANPASYIS
jgi:hypothetical protein